MCKMKMTPGFTPVKSALRKAGYQIHLSDTIAELGTKVKGGDVGNAVREFLNSDEVSAQCLNKNKSENLHYRTDYLSTLHEKFVIDTGISISYAMFTRYSYSEAKRRNGERSCAKCVTIRS